MKKGRLLAVLVALLLLASLAGCAPAKSVSTGAFDKNTYSNDFFNMTFQVPDGWSIASKEEMAQIFKVSEEMLGSDNKDAEKAMKLAEQKTLYLAYASKHPKDYADGINANINLTCENLGIAGLVVKDSKDYAKAAQVQLAKAFEGSSDYSYSFGDIKSKTINGVEFSALDATLSMPAGDGSTFQLPQRLYCTIKNNYALLFTLTWDEDADGAELESIVDTIQFK